MERNCSTSCGSARQLLNLSDRGDFLWLLKWLKKPKNCELVLFNQFDRTAGDAPQDSGTRARRALRDTLSERCRAAIDRRVRAVRLRRLRLMDGLQAALAA
jgi:hypothetical protein